MLLGLVRRLLRRLLGGAGLTTIKLVSSGGSYTVRVVNFRGVFKPWTDSVLLAESLSAENLKPGAAVLDMCTGSGVLSIVAARLGARTVTAVDVSRRALACTRLNALLHRVQVRTRRGDLFAALGGDGEGALFDVVVSNPPWLPSATEELPARGLSRAWIAGRDGRALIDRVCAEAPAHLRPGGVLLIVQASFCDPSATMELLSAQGLKVNVSARLVAPMLKVFGERAWEVQQSGPWARDDSTYEIVVIRASRPPQDEPATGVPTRRARAVRAAVPPVPGEGRAGRSA
jgi:release factor glutamine methyltransferase